MGKVKPVDQQYKFDGKPLVCQTDTDGIITYVNNKFSEVSSYEKSELVGQPMSIVRHPDMPSELFLKLWDTIKSGQAWNGILKNLRNDGHYYWVNTEILPVKDNNNDTIGYITVQKQASEKNVMEKLELYEKMLESQN